MALQRDPVQGASAPRVLVNAPSRSRTLLYDCPPSRSATGAEARPFFRLAADCSIIFIVRNEIPVSEDFLLHLPLPANRFFMRLNFSQLSATQLSTINTLRSHQPWTTATISNKSLPGQSSRAGKNKTNCSAAFSASDMFLAVARTRFIA